MGCVSSKTVPNTCGERKTNPKDESDQRANVATIPNVVQTADILKLNIDCLEEAFDYLTLKDLISTSKTCKRLQQVTGYFFRENLSIDTYCQNDVFKTVYVMQSVNGNGTCCDVEHLTPWIPKIIIYRGGFNHFYKAQSKFNRLKEIKFCNLSKRKMMRLKNINMKQLEVLSISDCNLHKNFHKQIDKCSKLKCLNVRYCLSKYEWLQHKYPTLQEIKIILDEDGIKAIKGVPMFFNLNPHIRSFTTTPKLLLQNRDELMRSNIKLDNLIIHQNSNGDERIEETKNICEMLNALHERGFYKKLQLSIWALKHKEIYYYATVNGLTKARIDGYGYGNKLSLLIRLQELCITNIEQLDDLERESLASDLNNLRRIYFDSASIDDIMLFVRQSVKLERIKVNDLKGRDPNKKRNKVIDLLALNKEREQLPNAQKITLCVAEEIYLPTKWAFGNTDFRLIRLKRNESDYYFNYFDDA